jgi:hypothetical protein
MPTDVKAIAANIVLMFDNNEYNVQEKAKESPEFYRCVMYTLYPPAEAIDGTNEYHAIVDEIEGLMNTK